MRRIRYQVASSLDGYIAGPGGEYDWIVGDSEIDFEEHFAQFGTLLMGRHTFAMLPSGSSYSKGQDVVVVSRTLDPAQHPGVTIIKDDLPGKLNELRAREGKDIWLFGGGELFRGLLEIDQVDTVELAVMPIVLGGGIPFLPSPAARRKLSLTAHRVFARSGIVMLNYDVVRAPVRKARKSASVPSGPGSQS